ncbi:MAG: VPLPA-CTERM sorting domain-containing protein [Gammaproteobacteria bacterium]
MNVLTATKSTFGVLALSAVLVSTVNAALFSRLDGQAYYDDVLDITWLTNTRAGAGSIHDDGDRSDDGRMSWDNAVAWAGSLTVEGVSDWRLPEASPVNGTNFTAGSKKDGSTDESYNISRVGTVFAGSTASEIAHLFYNTLGNVSNYSAEGVFDNGCTGSCLDNSGPFSNFKSSFYWTGTQPGGGEVAWLFSTLAGNQNNTLKDNIHYAWAVHTGDVLATVPVPAAAWLFASGLLGLVGVSKRLPYLQANRSD